MAELPKEMIERIRQSGRVHGIEDLREELMHHVKGNNVVISITELHDLVGILEERSSHAKH